jgi:hypothetical protein
MKTIQVTIKGVNDEVFREFKAESVREGLNVGSALTLAMKIWLDKAKKPKLNFLDLKPWSWGKGTENLSQEIDKVLYE